jgi:hypothetical protein
VASVIQCDACGGSVVYDAGHEAARCLFCGSVAVRPGDLVEIPAPEITIPFEVSEHRAGAAFRRWATSSWWYPKALREQEIELSAMMLPAWCFDAEVESHWTGLAPAGTKSGVRPRAGVAHTRARTMVPASMGLTEAELHRLQPFDERLVRDVSSEESAIPYELPALTEAGARPVAHARLEEEHVKDIARREGLKRCKGSSTVDFTTAKLLVLPIFIGSFRYRDLPWRFVINAQTGAITGKPPLDRVKIAAVAILGALVVLAWLLWQRA